MIILALKDAHWRTGGGYQDSSSPLMEYVFNSQSLKENPLNTRNVAILKPNKGNAYSICSLHSETVQDRQYRKLKTYTRTL